MVSTNDESDMFPLFDKRSEEMRKRRHIPVNYGKNPGTWLNRSAAATGNGSAGHLPAG
jgi:hypothetical protein